MMFNTPININKLTVKNRLVLPPMALAKADVDDHVTDGVIEYYAERAKLSGLGLIITEHMYVCKQGKAHPGQMSIASDDVIPMMKELTDAIHKQGVKVFAQISHAGTATSSALTGLKPVGPSAVFHPSQGQELPVEMTKDMIVDTVGFFRDAAFRAKKAGFDGVEIHCAHGYLLNQFLSPLSNHRDDEYGSRDIESRIRIVLDIVKAVRDTVGPDFPIAVRVGGCDYQEGGTVIDDAVKACVILEENGIDLLDITGGMYGFSRPGHREPGYFGEISAAVKANVHTPVILTGGVKSKADAEKLIEEGYADLIGTGRALMKDPLALEH